jgi:aminoglycoside phosphotransferase family enzyme
MVERLAEKLALFHRHEQVNEQLATLGGLDVLTSDMIENYAEAEPYIGRTITLGQYERIRAFSHGFLEHHAPLFDKRVADGRIRDCHGDLRAAHVCFNEGLCIFDCIEFNDRFRYVDVANEIAFLAMDLDFYAQPALSREFVHAYVEYAGDEELLALLDFYKCYRAYVRGKVEGFKLDDEMIGDEEKGVARDRAARFFELADSYSRMVANE